MIQFTALPVQLNHVPLHLLLHDTSANATPDYEFLADSAGMISTADYYPASASGATGYLKSTAIRNGEHSPSIPQTTLNYQTASLAGGFKVHRVSSNTVFRLDGVVPANLRPIYQIRDAAASPSVVAQRLESQFATYGNRTTPHPAQALSVAYDAWGNLTTLVEWSVRWEMGHEPHGEVSAQRDTAWVTPGNYGHYAYDALGRRIADGPLRYFYGPDGQVLEERLGGEVRIQYVRAPDGQLLLRDRSADHNPSTGNLGQPASGLDERLYALSDGQGNVAAVANQWGSILERYVYHPDGTRGVLSATFGPRDPAATKALDWRIGYHNGRLDPAGGLWYLAGKEHDPLTGGALMADPLAYADSPADDPTEVHPPTWRLITLHLVRPGGNVFEARMLRPLGWIEVAGATPGAMIPLSLPDIEVEGMARVVAVEPCPAIAPGRGRVVTLHLFSDIMRSLWRMRGCPKCSNCRPGAI